MLPNSQNELSDSALLRHGANGSGASTFRAHAKMMKMSKTQRNQQYQEQMCRQHEQQPWQSMNLNYYSAGQAVYAKHQAEHLQRQQQKHRQSVISQFQTRRLPYPQVPLRTSHSASLRQFSLAHTSYNRYAQHLPSTLYFPHGPTPPADHWAYVSRRPSYPILPSPRFGRNTAIGAAQTYGSYYRGTGISRRVANRTITNSYQPQFFKHVPNTNPHPVTTPAAAGTAAEDDSSFSVEISSSSSSSDDEGDVDDYYAYYQERKRKRERAENRRRRRAAQEQRRLLEEQRKDPAMQVRDLSFFTKRRNSWLAGRDDMRNEVLTPWNPAKGLGVTGNIVAPVPGVEGLAASPDIQQEVQMSGEELAHAASGNDDLTEWETLINWAS